MGYAVQVDPDVLAAGARRLAVAAQTLDVLAGRVLALCGCAASATGAGLLSAALDEAGRAAAGAVGQGAEAVGAVGTRTAQAGSDYQLLERMVAGRWATGGSPGTGPGAAAEGGAW